MTLANETGLSATRSSLQQAVGWFLGFGSTVASYTTAQLVKVNLAIDSGLNWFYEPEGETTHVWSFLTPIKPIAMLTDVANYDLPDDFGGIVGNVLYSADDSQWTEIKQTNASRILAMRQNGGSSSGPPQWIADTTIQTTGEVPTRYSLMVWPTPDADYTLQVPYRSNPYQLSTTAVYPMGGQPHAETLKESCLAAAEQKINGVFGIHTENFKRRLATSIKIDRKLHGTKHYGYNGDRKRAPMPRHVTQNLVTYMDIVPGE